MADQIGLTCTECKNRNYVTTVNKKNLGGKLQLNKFCPKCHKHTLHKESK
ncbi:MULTISPECIES: 50S ribosomal protein L33 [Jonquetella]|uniref:Large ribosomal subunit protein bL33 n=1 Tax=Jonquetella anthropi DSM 22815 TaxID=885272 RepID=H0UL62_9BACT|nr:MULTISPECIES: 50S ribosomal protein L33 [Jonquetella]EEX47984.1 ribosomal protein L33 [Jonquetella anthropi E3_33 E1]EHM13421.1 ribosomal protein L33 [Jonquetella anthropi DSM 22815]ERL24936.1 ribosomal protein L33 [Jonquetella sp. BV3C21]